MARSNLTELIAEVENDLSKYADAGLLDKSSMYKDAVRAIRKLGNDIAVLYDTVVEVKNGKGDIPINFRTLSAAYLCEPVGYKKSPEVEEHTLLGSSLYTERVVNSTKWNECDGCCEEVTQNVIRENHYFKHTKTAEFYYNNPVLLRLGKTFKKNACHKDCRNKYVRDNPNEIVIFDNTLQANFNEGFVYMIYYGLPQDEDGNITYPLTSNGSVEEFIEYSIKVNVTERLMGNKDASGLDKMYNIYEQRRRIAHKNASNELKMKNLTPDSFRRMHRLNQMDAMTYESALTNKSNTSYTRGRPFHSRY